MIEVARGHMFSSRVQQLFWPYDSLALVLTTRLRCHKYFFHTEAFVYVLLSLTGGSAVRAHPVGGGAERPVFRAKPVPEEWRAVAPEGPLLGLHRAVPNTARGKGTGSK